MANNLSKSILTTIAYHDVMDYPMTVFEIWKYLINSVHKEESIKQKTVDEFSLADIAEKLETEDLTRYIEEYRGYYFLRGKKELVDARLLRNKISEKKFKIIRKVVFWLRLVPFVKMIAIAGRVAAKNAENKSDLDIFVILKHGRLFTGRFLITIVAHLLGKRRHGKKVKNRICLNHFLSDRYEVSVKDLYSSQVYSFLSPIYSPIVFNEFLKKNDWIRSYRPNFKMEVTNLKDIKDTFFSKLVREFFEKVFSFDWIEKKLKIIQIRKIENNPKTFKKGGVVIYKNSELAFWPDFEKQGPRFFEKFYNRISKLN